MITARLVWKARAFFRGGPQYQRFVPELFLLPYLFLIYECQELATLSPRPDPHER
jgi:hypothetical protein